jgi:hypothetical protein
MNQRVQSCALLLLQRGSLPASQRSVSGSSAIMGLGISLRGPDVGSIEGKGTHSLIIRKNN